MSFLHLKFSFKSYPISIPVSPGLITLEPSTRFFQNNLLMKMQLNSSIILIRLLLEDRKHDVSLLKQGSVVSQENWKNRKVYLILLHSVPSFWYALHISYPPSLSPLAT